MSSTEIYGFGDDGIAVCIGKTQNAWLSAPKIWRIIEEKYLPPFIMHGEVFSRQVGGIDALQEVWELYDTGTMTETEDICLASTFDRVVVSAKNAPKVIDAFRKFDQETSLPQQADIIKENIENYKFFGWCQTTVVSIWESAREIKDENGEIVGYHPYNLNIDEKHWEMLE